MSDNRLTPWQKAAECQRVARTTTDSKERELLTYLEEMWTALANEAPFLTNDELANEMEVIRQIHSDMQADMAVPPPVPHQKVIMLSVMNG